MIRIGWFSPISTQTGIAQYSRNVLEELYRHTLRQDVEVIVFHPPTTDIVVEMPCPTIELSESLVTSDFAALFDVAIYHLGNNDKNHAAIYDALRRCPGVVVMHDYVYQHYLAGVSINGGFVGPSFGGLIHSVGGQQAFDFLADSGVLKTDEGKVLYVPWDGQWGTQFPMGDRFARLGSAAIVHSDYARKGLGAGYAGLTLQLFMPRPDEPQPLAVIATEGSRIHLVCGGHIGSTKGLRLLTAAFAENPALKTQYRVTIAGFGSDRAFLDLLEADIRDIGLAAVFDLCIDPNDDDFAAIMATGDVFYNLRYPNTEGASLSLVEQMAHHRAVIAYRTGCFAEIPEDACFFLERIGDVSELADLLGSIAADRTQLRIRGEKAWEAVRAQTAAKYATDLLTFLQANIDQLKARSALMQRRTVPVLPVVADRDQVWLTDYVAAKQLFDDFYDRRLYMPDGFLASPADEKCRFLLHNLLHTRVGAEDARFIAGILDKKPPMELAVLVGTLLRLAEQIVFNRALLAPALDDVALQVQDLDFWRIVLRLPIRMAVPMARAALAIPFDAVSELLTNSERDGTAPALHDYLCLHGDSLTTRAAIGSLQDFLRDFERVALQPVPRGADLVDLLRHKQRTPVLHSAGFHPVEQIGIWTAATKATLDLMIDSADALKRLSVHATSLVAGEQVEITVQEKDSTRREQRQVVFNTGPDQSNDVVTIDLPGFSGRISIQFSTETVQSPDSLEISADTRNLGILVYSLKLA